MQAAQQIERLQAVIRQKDEELQIANQNLDAANSAKSSLEMGKEKAKAEIHSLLRRVQEGESWLMTIREAAAKFTATNPREPFAHTWSKLETILQSKAAEAQKQASTSSTRKEAATGSGIEVSTKGIATSTPSAAANSDTESTSNTRNLTSKITPFGSFGDRHSMDDDLNSPFDDSAELERLFMSTPDIQNQAAALRASAPAPIANNEESISKGEPLMRRGKPDRRSSGSGLDKAIESPANPSVARAAGEVAKTEHSTVKRKAVSFGPQDSTTEPTGGSRQGSTQVDEDLEEDQSSKKTKRVHVHTYSRKRSDQDSQKVNASQTVTSENICEETMQHTSAKTTKASASQHPKTSRKSADASDALERRVSPRNLVSVSSQNYTAGQTTTGRGRRRSRSMMAEPRKESLC